VRAVVQRVSDAAVSIGGRRVASIGHGLVVLLGVRAGDGPHEAARLAEKIAQLRIFDDAAGRMNRSVAETGGDVLVVSQFTLYGDTRKGRRPSYIDAAPPATAEPLYARFVGELERLLPGRVRTGEFRAMMAVALVNDGPVTLLVEQDARPGHDQTPTAGADGG